MLLDPLLFDLAYLEYMFPEYVLSNSFNSFITEAVVI